MNSCYKKRYMKEEKTITFGIALNVKKSKNIFILYLIKHFSVHIRSIALIVLAEELKKYAKNVSHKRNFIVITTLYPPMKMENRF